jgi:hypothetical protein
MGKTSVRLSVEENGAGWKRRCSHYMWKKEIKSKYFLLCPGEGYRMHHRVAGSGLQFALRAPRPVFFRDRQVTFFEQLLIVLLSTVW